MLLQVVVDDLDKVIRKRQAGTGCKCTDGLDQVFGGTVRGSELCSRPICLIDWQTIVEICRTTSNYKHQMSLAGTVFVFESQKSTRAVDVPRGRHGRNGFAVKARWPC